MIKTSSPTVLVTGITGFLGAHCAKQLLAAGCNVKGTVRSLRDDRKIAHIRALQISPNNSLELVEADLLKADGWSAAVADCTYVLHVASPFPAAIPDDPDAVIKPAVDGTLNVLQAIANDPARSVKRVVLTSSIAALFSGRDQMQKVWNDHDWGILDDSENPVHPYPASKLLAERAAWDFVKGMPTDQSFELTTICAGLMCGPYLGGVPGTSAETIMRLMKRQMPAVPNIIFPGVDVRDIAEMHIRAMTATDADGQRFIGVSYDFAAQEVSQILSREFGPMGYRVTTTPMPNWLFRILSMFDSSLEAVRVHMGIRPRFDISPAEKNLGMTKWIGLSQSCIEQAYSLIANGDVTDKSNIQSLNATNPDTTALVQGRRLAS